MLPDTKVCVGCGNDLPLTAFGLFKEGKFGRRSKCKSCRADEERARRASQPPSEERKEKARKRARAWNADNKERKAEASKAWAEANPEKVKSSVKKWREGNREKTRAISNAWFKRNPGTASKASKSWRDRYPERYKASQKNWRLENAHYWRIRHLQEQSVPSDFTCADWECVLEEFSHACAYCLRQDVKLTMDHVVPISKGGAHTVGNIVPACKSCNSKKRDRSIFYMVGYRGA